MCSGQGWSDHLGPILPRCLSQSFSLLRGWWPGRVRQAVALGWTAKNPDEALEILPARNGQEASPFGRLDPVGVRRTLRHKEDVTRPCPVLAIANFEAHLSCKNMEHLVLTLVHVEGRSVLERGPVL